MTANGLIAFMKNGAIGQDGFDRSKDRFHHPKLFISQVHLRGRQLQVGLQNPEAVIPGFGTDFVFVNFEML